jgi:hypothetical protein
MQSREFVEVTSARVGVDYGTTMQHQSAMVVVTKNARGEVWVRAGWMSPSGSTAEMAEVARAWKTRFKVSSAHYDRSQGSLKDVFGQLGFRAYKGQSSVELRIGALRTLIEQDRFFVDIEGEGTQRVWSQLAAYRYDESDRVVEVQDDLVDALLYAVYAICEASTNGVGKLGDILPKKVNAYKPYEPRDFDPVAEALEFERNGRATGRTSMKDWGV